MSNVFPGYNHAEAMKNQTTFMKDLSFGPNEYVEVLIEDFKSNDDLKCLNLTVLILTGDNSGKKASWSIFSQRKDGSPSFEAIAFYKAFYTDEELTENTADPIKLVQRKFSAIHKSNVYKGETYQNWSKFKDLGAFSIDEVF